MTDDRRLTTDRFYGGTSQRLHLLKQFLRFITDASGMTTRSEAKDWLLENTRAQSRDAIDHHLGFLDAIELIDLDGDEVSIERRGEYYLESPEDYVLYDALRANVKGFDSILAQLRESPMTDEDIMQHLKDEFEDIEMETPEVATRHREWLEVLGYVERTDSGSRLTEKGRRIESKSKTDGMMDREKVRELRSRLLQNDMGCVPNGRQSVSEGVYTPVRETYPRLCDDSYLCSEAHDTGRESPEWKHVVQEALQQLANNDDSRVSRDNERGTWMFHPKSGPREGYERSDRHDESDVTEAVTELPGGSETTRRRETVREEVVRDEALVRDIKSMYDDRCQICGEKRLQGPDNGYSEVHHLMPLGDDGPDIPENVVVVCPNHHIDFENGMIAIDPQTLEISHQYESEVVGRNLLFEDGHDVGREYLAYHNQVVAYPEIEPRFG